MKLTPAQQKLLVRAHPACLRLLRAAGGLKGATNVRLRVATVAILRGVLETAWKNVAPPAILAAGSRETAK